MPRFGAAYRLTSKTVLRGGFGLFAGFLGERRGDVIQPGFTRTTALPLTTLPNGAQIPNAINLFPTLISILEPVGNAAGKLTGLGGGVTFFNQNPKSAKQFRYQIGVQRQLPLGFVFEAVYVGNRGYDIEMIRDLNAIPVQYLNGDNALTATTLTPAAIANNNILGASVTNPFRNVAGFEGTNFFTSATIARSQLLRPFPQFTSVISSNNDGESWYHSGQFGIQKRFSQGNTIQANYTWSKWLQATEYLNAGDPKPTKMLADQDSPHRFSFSGIFALPFGKGARFANNNAVLDRFVGGWQFQGVYTFQVGFPIAFGSYSITAGSTTGDIFYLGGDVSLPDSVRNTALWFNKSAFATVTPQSHLRTLPYRFADVRRDNINNVDLSLIKNTRINEGMRIQFRLEAINAFNEPYFQAPATAIGSSFGSIASSTANQANYARRMQIGIKFLF